MPRAFTDELRDLRGGVLADDLTAAFAGLVLDVVERRKPGELTLTLKVAPMSATSQVLVVTDVIKVKSPQPQVDETIMFPTPEGSLVLDNPKQQKMEFKVATPAPANAGVAPQTEGGVSHG